MGRSGAVVRIVVVVLVLVNTVAAGAVAGDPPRRVLLDTEATEVATVHTNGRTFVAYEYDSALPYAGGIEVFAGGGRVTSADTVDEVFTALARRRATKFKPESRTIERLQRVAERSRAVQAATDDAISALNDTVTYRAQLKERRINGTSAWEVATERSAALDGTFAGSITGPSDAVQLREQLAETRRLAADLETNATRAVTLLRKRQEGAEINRSDLYRRYDAVYADLRELSERDPGRALSRTTEASRAAATQAGSVPTVGNELERRFGSLGDSLQTAADRLAEAGSSFGELRETLPKPATDRQYQARLTEEWRDRQGVVLKVYATLAEGGIVLIAGAIAVFEVRS